MSAEVGVGPLHAVGRPLYRDRIGAGDCGVDLVRLKPGLTGEEAEHVGQVFQVETVVQLVEHSLVQQGSGGEGVGR